MKTFVLAALRCSWIFLVPTVTYAISAQWNLDPISGDWNTAANWTPMDVPSGPADIATFGLSNTTDVSISADTEVKGITFTSAATNPYYITASSPGLTLRISGVGITNNSGITQNINFSFDRNDLKGTLAFSKNATAGSNLTIFNGSDVDNVGADINFFNTSTAGSATISNIRGNVIFGNRSTAANSTITGILQSHVSFSGNSTAGSALIGFGDLSSVEFGGNSTAGSASISVADSSILVFDGNSTAGSASISAGLTSFILFSGSSSGGTAQINLFFDSGLISSLDISDHNAPGVTIGSLAGDHFTLVELGANNLTVGSNNLSTTYAGEIFGGGSLTKIGSGTLILSGANTYTGDTNVNRGVLQVDGSITSNTYVNRRGTLAGTGTINGNVTNNGRVSPGSAGSPGMLTVTGNFTQAQYVALMIKLRGESAGQFSVLNVMGNADLNGTLNPVLLNGFVPSLGDSFVFLNYASLTGEFSHIRDPLPGDGLIFGVIYEANHAILTVEQNVPDRSSTFLLLTLGLLGLVTFRRQLHRGQT